ncbi:YncE family protein [Phaeovulum sp. W22_SRMD_FR3]|uniref:YncE family protein n=1 Tax=Phaeovulum sp. W22_SRMD_FR3 TaxID=3240274 RepID=UPI003F99432F
MQLKTRITGAMTALALSLAVPAAAQEATAQVDLAQIAPAALRQDLLKGVYGAVEIPGRNQLWVASSPSFEQGTPGFVDILDATDLRPLRRIELPRRAFALALDAARGRAYVGNTLDGSLTVLDAASGLVLDTIQLGKPDGEGFEHTRMVRVDPGSGQVFVTSPSDTGTLWIVDPDRQGAVQRIDDAGLWSAGLALDAARGRVYATGGGISEVLVVDAATGAGIGSFSTGDTKEAGGEASAHFFVNAALDTEGKRLFAADANQGALYVFDTETGAVIATAPTGLGTLDVIYSDKRDQIFVTYRGVSREAPSGSGGIVVLDASDYARIADIPLPAHPNSLVLAESGDALFVTVKAPMEKEHPLYREGGGDSVLRFDLDKLATLLPRQ